MAVGIGHGRDVTIARVIFQIHIPNCLNRYNGPLEPLLVKETSALTGSGSSFGSLVTWDDVITDQLTCPNGPYEII